MHQRNIHFSLLAGVAAAIAGSCLLVVTPPTSGGPPAVLTSAPAASNLAVLTSTPEESVKTFIQAMFSGNTTAGEACSLPVDGRDILWEDAGPQNPSHQKEIKNFLDDMTLGRFKVGDTFKLPGGESLTFDEQRINDTTQQILVRGMPTPFSVQRQADGQWLVDPRPLIVSRNIAEAMRGGKPVSPVATRPTPPVAKDYSSPEATFKSWMACMRDNDLNGSHACFVDSTDLSREFMGRFLTLTITTRRLQLAVKSHMPDEAKAIGDDLLVKIEKQYADAVLVTDNGTIWLTQHGQTAENRMAFRKIGDDWKIDTEKNYHLDTYEGRDAAEALIGASLLKVANLNSIIRDIDSGKIKTLAEIRRA